MHGALPHCRSGTFGTTQAPDAVSPCKFGIETLQPAFGHRARALVPIPRARTQSVAIPARCARSSRSTLTTKARLLAPCPAPCNTRNAGGPPGPSRTGSPSAAATAADGGASAFLENLKNELDVCAAHFLKAQRLRDRVEVREDEIQAFLTQ